MHGYSSQALQGAELKPECLFLISLELLFALYCNFWHKSYLKVNFSFESDKVA